MAKIYLRRIAAVCASILFVTSVFAQTQAPARPAQGAGAPAAAPADPFAKWEKEVAAMEAADKVNPPPKGGVLFIGSSSVRMWKTLASDFPYLKVVNRGFGGTQIIDAAHFADRLIFPHQPKAVVLFAGGNDINAKKTPEQVFEDFKTFVKTVRGKLPEAEIYFIGQQPRISRWAQNEKLKRMNALIEGYCKENPKMKYIDTWSMTITPEGGQIPELYVKDMLHFNELGYRKLVEVVRPHLPKE